MVLLIRSRKLFFTDYEKIFREFVVMKCLQNRTHKAVNIIKTVSQQIKLLPLLPARISSISK